MLDGFNIPREVLTVKTKLYICVAIVFSLTANASLCVLLKHLIRHLQVKVTHFGEVSVFTSLSDEKSIVTVLG